MSKDNIYPRMPQRAGYRGQQVRGVALRHSLAPGIPATQVGIIGQGERPAKQGAA